jgi:hypothetical protein
MSKVPAFLLGAFVAIPLTLTASSLDGFVTFTNGTVADADQVNSNFDEVLVAVNDNDSRLDGLEGAITASSSGGGSPSATIARATTSQGEPILQVRNDNRAVLTIDGDGRTIEELPDGTTQIIRKPFSVLFDDNVATEFIKITADGSPPGQAWFVTVRGMVTHGVSSGTGTGNANAGVWSFVHNITGSPRGDTTAVIEQFNHPAIGNNSAGRGFGTISILPVELSESELSVQIRADLTGTSAYDQGRFAGVVEILTMGNPDEPQVD